MSNLLFNVLPMFLLSRIELRFVVVVHTPKQIRVVLENRVVVNYKVVCLILKLNYTLFVFYDSTKYSISTYCTHFNNFIIISFNL